MATVKEYVKRQSRQKDIEKKTPSKPTGKVPKREEKKDEQHPQEL